MQVMQAESECNPEALNPTNSDGSSDGGLFQVNSIHCATLIPCGERFDPIRNIEAAYKIYAGGGWAAWSVCRTKVNCY